MCAIFVHPAPPSTLILLFQAAPQDLCVLLEHVEITLQLYVVPQNPQPSLLPRFCIPSSNSKGTAPVWTFAYHHKTEFKRTPGACHDVAFPICSFSQHHASNMNSLPHYCIHGHTTTCLDFVTVALWIPVISNRSFSRLYYIAPVCVLLTLLYKFSCLLVQQWDLQRRVTFFVNHEPSHRMCDEVFGDSSPSSLAPQKTRHYTVKIYTRRAHVSLRRRLLRFIKPTARDFLRT